MSTPYLYLHPRASNGLLKLLRYLEGLGERRPVLFPADICYTFPLAASLSNLPIRFADVDYDTLWISLKGVRPEEHSLIVVVVPYGNLILEELEEVRRVLLTLYRVHGVRILWDMALVMPTQHVLKHVIGTISDGEYFSFSFSYGKQIELGYGALLISPHPIDMRFPRVLSAQETRYYVNKVDKLFKGSLSRYGSRTWFYLREHPKVRACYESELALDDAEVIEEMLDEVISGDDPLVQLRDGRAFLLSEIVEHKASLYKTYLEMLAELIDDLGLEGEVLALDRIPLSWRFNLRLPSQELRDRYLNLIFSQGLFASRLFPVIARYFGDEGRYPSASEHWRRVVNLFNNHLISQEDAERLMRCLKEVLVTWRGGGTPSGRSP